MVAGFSPRLHQEPSQNSWAPPFRYGDIMVLPLSLNTGENPDNYLSLNTGENPDNYLSLNTGENPDNYLSLNTGENPDNYLSLNTGENPNNYLSLNTGENPDNYLSLNTGENPDNYLSLNTGENPDNYCGEVRGAMQMERYANGHDNSVGKKLRKKESLVISYIIIISEKAYS